MSKFVNTKNKKIILGIILLAVIIGGSYGAYSVFFSGTETPPEQNEPETPSTVTVVDKTGAEVTLTQPVDRIVAIIAAEFISALGCEDTIVGRAELTTDEEAILPASVLSVPVVAETSFSVNLELILEQNPQLVIASEGLDDSIRVQLEDAGVAVLEESSTFPRRETFIQNLGLILDAEDEANNLIEYEAYYENLVKERVASLTEEEKPTVFFEWYMEWYSTGANGSYNEMINTAGGVNIAANQPEDSASLSAEFVAEANPDMIVRMLTFYDGEELEDYQTLYNGFLNRTGLEDTTAVENQEVYIIKNTVLVARRPIGLLYLAKWFHPTLFEDITPSAVHQEYVDTFFGATLSGVFVYSKETTEPTEPTEPETETITVVDAVGNEITLSLPLEKVVSLNSGLTEILCALGGEDKIIGRDEGSTFPESVSEVTVVGENSYNPNMEMILDLAPDVVIADTMLSYKTEELETFAAAGIPVVIEAPTDYTRLAEVLTYFGEILDEEETAVEIVEFITYYEDLVNERVETLTESEKPTIYIEWNTEWRSFAEGSVSHQLLNKTGGINIITDGTSESASPTLSAEFVAEANPDVIVRMASVDTGHLAEYEISLNELITRSGLTDTNAVAENQVYLYDSLIFQGVRYPVGLLYWAKWFNPTLFADIDPAAVHEELIQKFLGEDIEGTYAYPEIVTVVDALGNEVTITLPVERIVSLTGGLTEIVCALGGEDQIVGRGEYSTFPPSVIEIPIASASSYSVNMETLLEFEPDLVLADTMMSSKPEYIEQIQGAGIPLIVENTANVSRIAPIIGSLGVIVDNKETANELIEWMDYYVDLVNERTATLSESDMPSVYMEWTSSWKAIGPGHAIGQLMESAGGINIVTNATATTTTVSPEFVLTENPEVMFATTYSMPAPTEVSFYEGKMTDVFSQTGISSTTAATDENIHLYSYRIIQGIRYPIGLLYFAKCMHPALYEDIDPITILDDMIDQFFGIELDAIYVYP